MFPRLKNLLKWCQFLFHGISSWVVKNRYKSALTRCSTCTPVLYTSKSTISKTQIPIENCAKKWCFTLLRLERPTGALELETSMKIWIEKWLFQWVVFTYLCDLFCVWTVWFSVIISVKTSVFFVKVGVIKGKGVVIELLSLIFTDHIHKVEKVLQQVSVFYFLCLAFLFLVIWI